MGTQPTTPPSEAKKDDIQVAVEKPLMKLLGKYKGQITAILPKQLNDDRVLKLIVGSINKNPKLLQCTPISVINSVLTAAAIGLEIRPGSAYLIPFAKNFKDANGWHKRFECQLVIDYRSEIDLALRSGKVRSEERRVGKEGRSRGSP